MQAAQPEDSLTEQVSEWICEREAADGLVSKWQSLEHEVSRQARSLSVDFEKRARSNLSESQRMRVLEKQIAAAERRLEELADQIANQQSWSAQGALAKIRLGLHMAQFPVGDETPWALVKAGFEDLRAKLE
jgi:hypothetical protein